MTFCILACTVVHMVAAAQAQEKTMTSPISSEQPQVWGAILAANDYSAF